MTKAYPIVDLFAGPGGLGEGFSALTRRNKYFFKAIASIEQDEFAHRTLFLRHFFRSFKPDNIPDEYYRYISGNLPLSELESLYPKEWAEAKQTALRITLGTESHKNVQKIISARLKKNRKWVLVGGPPCQAYSLVGRSRRANDPDFEQDERHFLYREYLKIISDHAPPIFVMENVKGLLSAKVGDKPVFQKILKDLSNPQDAIKGSSGGLNYTLYSLNSHGEFRKDMTPTEFVVKAEEYGVPQKRHRVFILGIRSDLAVQPEILQPVSPISLRDVIGQMPRIRSGISKGGDSSDKWKKLLLEAPRAQWFSEIPETNLMNGYGHQTLNSTLSNLPSQIKSSRYVESQEMKYWYHDEKLDRLTLHDARSHMESDLYRYLFASTFAKLFKISPKLSDFPESLLPKHRNIKEGKKGKMFADRFRVQLPHDASTTITSHISKDGHYYIHFDPRQCRSLTVREVARLQTFPDNYFFEGPRTSQYHQVGNAVPPFLARQIAVIIKDILDRMPGE